MGVATQRGSDLNRIGESASPRSQADVGHLPDETALPEVGREKDFHAQFWVAQKGLHTNCIVVGTGQCIVPIFRISVRVVRFGFRLGIWSRRVFGCQWGDNLLQ